MEMVAPAKRHEAELERIRNGYIRGTARVELFGGKAEMVWECAAAAMLD